MFAREKKLVEIGEVQATFDLDDGAFAELRRALELAFRAFGSFRVASDA